MSPIVTHAGVDLAYAEQGAGAPALLIHGLAADLAALEPLAARIAGAAGGARVITYSRRGYAGSGAPEPYLGTTVAEQAEDAAALVTTLAAAPACVMGEDFGALIALDLLIRHRDLVRAAVLVDPPLYALARDATRELSDWQERLREAVAEGGPSAGVAAHLAGRGADADRRRAEAAHAAFFADVAGLTSLPVTRAQLRAIDVPVAVVTGGASSPATVEAADALAGLIPGAARTLDGDIAGAVPQPPR